MTAKRVIGVDVGGTNIRAAVVGPDGSIERLHECATPGESQAALVEALVAAVGEVRDEDVRAVGFGVPARISADGVALGAVNAPIDEIAFPEVIGARLGLTVTVVNDASAAALAEHRIGAGRGTRNLVLLTLGTGVGGGVVIEGSLYRGWSELGHMVIVAGGVPCQGACTGLGHVESYCSGTAADKIARRVLGEDATAHDLVAQRHPALEEIGRYLGAAIGSIVNVFDPEVVVLGGGFGVAAGELLFEAARPIIEREALGGAPGLRLALAELGEEAGIVGAALVALETV